MKMQRSVTVGRRCSSRFASLGEPRVRCRRLAQASATPRRPPLLLFQRTLHSLKRAPTVQRWLVNVVRRTYCCVRPIRISYVKPFPARRYVA